jgi:hypothetical protein
MRFTVALLALLTASAGGSPALAQERPPEQAAVYRDFEDDGFLDACAHEEDALQEVLDGIDAETDADTPDFRPKVEAALAQRQAGDCGDEPAGDQQDLAGGGAADDPAGGQAGTATPAPEESGATGGATPAPEESGATGGATPPTADDVEPLPPEITPVPTPAAAPVPAAPAAPAPATAVAYRNEDDDVPVALLALAGLLGAIALLALAYALLGRIPWVDDRLAGTRRAWREAGFRAGGTWGDFTDWLRLGR